MIFDYPEPRPKRTHGPTGYTAYESFRPWLRDEFTFRCVYCLKREQWGQVTGEFELDHFEPRSISPESGLTYANLVYACRRCNAVKQDLPINDPLTTLAAGNVAISPDGALVARSSDVERLIKQLDLNSPRLTRWRLMWLRIVDLARQRDESLFKQLLGFPADLPNLANLRPPANSKPASVDNCWFARRKRGELPEVY